MSDPLLGIQDTAVTAMTKATCLSRKPWDQDSAQLSSANSRVCALTLKIFLYMKQLFIVFSLTMRDKIVFMLPYQHLSNILVKIANTDILKLYLQLFKITM